MQAHDQRHAGIAVERRQLLHHALRGLRIERGHGLVGQQLFAGETTRLAYMTDEAVEGRDSFLEKREPDWSAFPWYY